MTVFLVGGGPGDPGLLTVRGAELLRRADVVMYDRLSAEVLLDLAPPAAERIGVGKTPRHPSISQEEINALLVEKGKAGGTVVRLKGGDPFVFGRGGEEAQALADAGVPFEIVPGVPAAFSVPAYAGVPATQRGVASAITIVTGQNAPWADDETNWDAVARVGGTIIVYMATAVRADVAAKLIAAGMSSDTPVVATTWGTTPEQHTVRTTLAGLGAADVRSPAIILIGAVGALNLSWYEDRPLFGCRVVVTRAAEQADVLAARLHALGAGVLVAPSISVEVPGDGSAGLQAAVDALPTYDWVVFSSANAVGPVMDLVRDARAFGTTRIAAVGSSTARALADHNLVADLVPERFVAEEVVQAFPSGGGRVLLPQAAAARPVLRDGLATKGWHVDVVEAYRTVPVPLAPDLLAAAKDASAITFTASSTVDAWVDAAGIDGTPPVVVCIGPVTAETAAVRGLAVTAVADPHTIDGLVSAVSSALSASMES